MVFNTKWCTDIVVLLVKWHGRDEKKFIGYPESVAPSSHIRWVGPMTTS